MVRRGATNRLLAALSMALAAATVPPGAWDSMSRDRHQGMVSARSRLCSWIGEPPHRPLVRRPNPFLRDLMTPNASNLFASCRSCPKLREPCRISGANGGIASAIVRYIMNKPRMNFSRKDSATPALVVRVQRKARSPTPWTWAIHEDGQPAPLRCSTRFYRSAEDAWKVGRAMLDHLPRATSQAVPLVHQNASPNMRLPYPSPDGRDSRVCKDFDIG
jgi:hypothetical protein